VPLSNKQNYWLIEFSNRLTALGFRFVEVLVYLAVGFVVLVLAMTSPMGMATVAMLPLTVVSVINSWALMP
jgi:hypothetical protein